MTKLIPTSDRVLVKQVEITNKTLTGIIIPDSAKEKTHQGTIIAVGPGVMQNDGTVRPVNLNVGDQVLFNRYSSSEITFQGEKYLMMFESDVLGVITK